MKGILKVPQTVRLGLEPRPLPGKRPRASQIPEDLILIDLILIAHR